MIADAVSRLVSWGLHKVGFRALVYLACLVIVFGDIVAGLNSNLARSRKPQFLYHHPGGLAA